MGQTRRENEKQGEKMAAYTYDSLKSKYKEFLLPMVNISVGGKEIGSSKTGLLISGIEVELSSGYEASAATFHIYNCMDAGTGEFIFDDLKQYISLGSAVGIEFGYGGVMTEVFKGLIVQVQFICEEEDIPNIEVFAMDAKGMMMSNSYARQMKADCYSDAVKEIFSKAAYQKLQSEGIITSLDIQDTPDKKSEKKQKAVSETIEMVSESDYEFTVKAAKRFHYEFFVENGKVCFRKAKQVSGCLMELGLLAGILSYQVSYDIRGLVQKIEARGMDSGKGELISASQKFGGKISMGNKAKALLSKTEKVYIDSTITSKEQAASRVESLMDKMSYQFGSLECECIGLPELKPGQFVDITGFGGPVDNRFYITSVRHILNEEGGYKTKLSGKAAAIEKTS